MFEMENTIYPKFLSGQRMSESSADWLSDDTAVVVATEHNIEEDESTTNCL